MTTIELPIKDLTLDPGCQPRAEMNQAVVDEYAIAMAEDKEFEPVVVFHDGHQYWLVDGWHRVAAAKQAGLDTISVVVRKGNRRDAILFAAGTNATHGLRRTNSDKRRAVTTLLGDPEWSQWSDAKLPGGATSHIRLLVNSGRPQLVTVSSRRSAGARTVSFGTLRT